MLDKLTDYLLHPALWIAVLIIGMLGEIAKNLALGPKKSWPKDGFRGWRGVYVVTYKAHALVVGALMGLIPGLPVTDLFKEPGSNLGAVMFYCGAGAISMIAYATIVGSIKTAISNYGKRLGAAAEPEVASGGSEAAEEPADPESAKDATEEP
jgi:hypothetical protein